MAIYIADESFIATRGEALVNDPEFLDMATSALDTYDAHGTRNRVLSTGALGYGWRNGVANGLVKAKTGKAARWLAVGTTSDAISDRLHTLGMRLAWGTTTKDMVGNPLDLSCPEDPTMPHKAIFCELRNI